MIDVAKRAAHDLKRVIRALRWGEQEDAEQEGYLAILQAGVQEPRLAYVIARRGILKAMRKNRPEEAEQTYLEGVEALGTPMTLEVADMIEKCPNECARKFMQYRVLDGLTWEETQAVTGMSNDVMNAARTYGGEWIMKCLEGRK